MEETQDYHVKVPIHFYDNIIKLTSLKESYTSEGYKVEMTEERLIYYKKWEIQQ